MGGVPTDAFPYTFVACCSTISGLLHTNHCPLTGNHQNCFLSVIPDFCRSGKAPPHAPRNTNDALQVNFSLLCDIAEIVHIFSVVFHIVLFAFCVIFLTSYHESNVIAFFSTRWVIIWRASAPKFTSVQILIYVAASFSAGLRHVVTSGIRVAISSYLSEYCMPSKRWFWINAS